jgi:hypothetical protein
VEVRFPDGAPASGLAVRAEVFHGLARRVLVAFVPDGPGAYAAHLPVDGVDGLWQGVIRVEGGRRPLVADIAFTVRRELEADVALLRRPMGFRPAGVFTSPPWVDHLVWAGVLGLVLGCALVVGVRQRPAPPPAPGLRLPGWATAVGVVGALAGAAGAYWDVAWHVDQGRETFWSPPHLLLYSGILSVVASIGLALLRAPGDSRRAALRHRGLRFAAIAGAATLLSAPFDEGWHRLFGLDVSIWSPPHLVLLFGSALAILSLALLHGTGASPRARHLALVLMGAVALLIVNIFVLEFEFPTLEGWHVLLARPRGLYPLFTTALALFVLGSVARAGGGFAATQAAAAAWVLRAALGVALLPALGRSAPLWPPLYVLPALALDLVLAAAPVAWTIQRRFLVGGLAATAVAYLGHNGVAAVLPGRAVPTAELWGWFPLALLAGAAAAVLGLRIGMLARPEPGTPA